MQLHKFHGRTMGGLMARIRRELGPDALILETRTLQPGDAAARMNPGAKYEVLAARDPYVDGGREPVSGVRDSVSGVGEPGTGDGGKAGGTKKFDYDYEHEHEHEHENINFQSAIPNPQSAIPRTRTLLGELGLLRSQLRDLLEDDQSFHPGELDLADYRELIGLGVDHQVLAPHFRRWLEWRTAALPMRRYLARTHGGPAAAIKGDSLREWLWLAWSEGQGFLKSGTVPAEAPAKGPKIVGLIGPTGGGKTTTLAKLSSILCHKKRQKAVVVTLDTHRYGATEQWKKYSRLMGLPVEEIVSEEDLNICMEKWGDLDWVGIDTPGGMAPHSDSGRLYGSILAHWPVTETIMVLPATQQDAISRDQMARGRAFGAGRVLFSKLDETARTGGIVNLTMNGSWKIDSFTTGGRVPQDWEAAGHESLWRLVLAPRGAHAFAGGCQ